MAWDYEKAKKNWEKPTLADSAWHNLIGGVGTAVGNLGAGGAQLSLGAVQALDEATEQQHPTLQNILKSGRDFGFAISDAAQKYQAPYTSNPAYENMGIYDRLTNRNYLTDPRGMTADIFQGFGSSLPFMAFGGLLTRAGVAPASYVGNKLTSLIGKTDIGSKALSAGSKLLNNRFGNVLGETARTGANYATTTAPLDALTNAAEIIRPLKERGFNDQEISSLMGKSIFEELPIDVASNMLQGSTIFGKGFGLLGKSAKGRLGYGLLNLPLEMAGEYAQEGNQTRTNRKYLGMPYIENPLSNFAKTGNLYSYPEEQNAATAGGIGAIIPGAGGAVHSALFGGDKTIQNENFPQVTPSQAAPNETPANDNNLVSWARDNVGGDERIIKKIIAEAKAQGVDPREVLAIGKIESDLGLNPSTSEVGAVGVMQLMPETAKELGFDPYNEDENIRAGITYYKKQREKFGDPILAAAAYNAGPGAVEKAGGVPPYKETEAYAEKMQSILDSGKEYTAQNSQTENIYTGENGKAEGKYWNRQTGNVSIEGLQPQGLNALDMLGKWFYEKTGKPLILTSGTDGKSHTDGEHSHYNGWKFDVNDWDGNSDGFLVTADGSKGTLTDEFIAYGRSLGLGMNWEGDHIDVALDGNQWDGNGENAGGFNLEKIQSTRKTSATNNTDEEIQAPKRDETIDKIISDLLTKKSEPLFKLDAEDELTKNIYKEFAETKKENATGEELAKAPNFFEKFFDKDGKFKNTKENRQAVAEIFGDEFINFGQENLNSKIAEYKNFLQTRINPLSEEVEKITSYLDILKNDYDNFRANEADDEHGRKFLGRVSRNIFKTSNELTQKLNELAEIQNILNSAETITAPVEEIQQVQSEEVQPQMTTLQTFQTEIDELQKQIKAERKKLSSAIDSKDKVAVTDSTKNIQALQQQLSDKNAEIENYKKSPEHIQNQTAELENLKSIRDNISAIINSGGKDKNLSKQFDDLQKEILSREKELQKLQEPQIERNPAIQKIGAKYVVSGGKNPKPAINIAEEMGGKYIAKDNNFAFETPEAAQDFLWKRGEIADAPSGEYQSAGIYGGNTTAETSNGRELNLRYKIVPSESLNTSHKFKGGGIFKNNFYPQELQPRNRESKTLQAQVIEMANNLNPRKVVDSVYLNEGAPIVREDGIVLNGNARTMAIDEAGNLGKAAHYKKYLVDNAEKFGFKPEEIEKIKNPVLVREVAESLDADKLNEITKSSEGGATFNPTELAQNDADAIKFSDFSEYNPNSNGDLTAPSNRKFVNEILNRVEKSTKAQNRYRTAEGDLNSEAVNRVKRAVFSLAYGDDNLTSKMAESIDDDIKNISKAAESAAVDFAKLKLKQRSGYADEYDIGGVIADAIKFYEKAKHDERFKNVSEFINQDRQNLFDPRQNAVYDAMEVFDRYKNRPQMVADFLKDVVKMADRKPNPDQINLDFGGDIGTYKKARIDEIVRAVRDEYLQEIPSGNQAESFAKAPQTENDLPQGYKTESGRNLDEADAQEFILKPNGSKNFGRIDEEIAHIANQKMTEDNSDFRFKAAPIRLQVGFETVGDVEGFGYKHILENIDEIKSRGFDNVPSYVEHILNNFNQVRKSSEKEKRIVLYCKGDQSKGLMPLDLELEKGDEDFYTIVSAYPRRRTKKEDPLILDVRPTNTPNDTFSLPHRDIADRINESSDENISQSEEFDNAENERRAAEQVAREKMLAENEKTESQKIYERGEQRAREKFENQAEENISDEQTETQSKEEFDSRQEKMHEEKPSIYREGNKFIVHVGDDVSRTKLMLFGTFLKKYNGKYRKGTQTFEFSKASAAMSFATDVEITKMKDEARQKMYRAAKVSDFPILKAIFDAGYDNPQATETLNYLQNLSSRERGLLAIQALLNNYRGDSEKLHKAENYLSKLEKGTQQDKEPIKSAYDKIFDMLYGNDVDDGENLPSLNAPQKNLLPNPIENVSEVKQEKKGSLTTPKSENSQKKTLQDYLKILKQLDDKAYNKIAKYGQELFSVQYPEIMEVLSGRDESKDRWNSKISFSDEENNALNNIEMKLNHGNERGILKNSLLTVWSTGLSKKEWSYNATLEEIYNAAGETANVYAGLTKLARRKIFDAYEKWVENSPTEQLKITRRLYWEDVIPNNAVTIANFRVDDSVAIMHEVFQKSKEVLQNIQSNSISNNSKSAPFANISDKEFESALKKPESKEISKEKSEVEETNEKAKKVPKKVTEGNISEVKQVAYDKLLVDRIPENKGFIDRMVEDFTDDNSFRKDSKENAKRTLQKILEQDVSEDTAYRLGALEIIDDNVYTKPIWSKHYESEMKGMEEEIHTLLKKYSKDSGHSKEIYNKAKEYKQRIDTIKSDNKKKLDEEEQRRREEWHRYSEGMRKKQQESKPAEENSDIEKLIERFEGTVADPTYETFRNKSDAEKEAVTKYLLDRLEKRFKNYKDATEKFNNFEENYNSPQSAVVTNEREEVRKIADKLGNAKSAAKGRMEETLESVNEFIENVKNLPPEISDRYKKIMRDINVFEGFITDQTKSQQENNPETAKPHRIFGTLEETERELKEAFGIIDENEESAPAEDDEIPADKFVNVIDDSDEALARYVAEWNAEMKKMSAMPMFNPKLWSAGLKIGLVHIQRGINKFANWAKQMTKTLGKESEAWQSAIWETLKTMPEIKDFNDKQITSIAKRIGALYENGTTSLDEIQRDFEKNLGKDNAQKLSPMIKASYNGIEKFFTDNVNKNQSANIGENLFDENDIETKKVADNENVLPQSYRTESGRNLDEADSQEFIIKTDGTKNFGQIDEETAKIANDELKNSKLKVEMKPAPIRLQVGNENFGYIHLVKRHLSQIKDKGFENAIDFIDHTLENYNQIYDQSHIHKKSGKLIKRFVLYCKGDESKGFMPLDLELEKGTEDYYTIVSANPHNENIKGELVFDDSSQSSTATADGLLIEDSNDKDGVVSSRANAKTNSPAENISQSEQDSKNFSNDSEIDRKAKEALKAAGLEGKTVENYIPVLSFYATIKNHPNQFVFVEHENYQKVSSTVKKNVSKLSEECNGEKFKSVDCGFIFKTEFDGLTFFKALQTYFNNEGVNWNESIELEESGRTAGGHQVRESAVRETADETARQEGNDKISERVSGQQRQDTRESDKNVAGTNAENTRPVSVPSERVESGRTGERNGVRGSASVVQSATGTERGNSRVSESSPNVEFSGHNFHITEDSEIGEGGAKTKFKQNIDAIKLLKQLESEGRKATPSEQKILTKFNGWGSVAQAFASKDEWQKQAEELKSLLTDEEYERARNATFNAFYTHPKIAQTIWQGLERIGFKGGKILEPAIGSGIFFGTMPREIMARSELSGVEKDSLTGRIAQQLYQKAAIDIIGFEDRKILDNYFDLVISNVPFSKRVRIKSDKQYKNQNYALHNYYFAKAIDKVRPGGFVAFITSQGTMQTDDKQSRKLREELNEKADLIAAFKLPSNAFQKNAGTQVTTDILILQKRLDPKKPAEYAQNWSEIGKIDFIDTSKGYRMLRELPINEYFNEHPEHMIGTPIINTMYRGEDDDNVSLALDGKDRDIEKELSELMSKLPQDIFQPYKSVQQVRDTLKNTFLAMADAKQYENSFSIYEGKIVQKIDDKLVEVPKQITITQNKKRLKIDALPLIKDFLTLQQSLDNLLKAQLSPETTNEKLSELRKRLNQNYDKFVKNHGYLNSQTNLKILGIDPNFGKVAAIENYRENKNVVEGKDGKKKTEITISASKADIFYKRTFSPLPDITSADNALDALRLSLSRHGYIDTDYMSKLTGKNSEELAKELGDLVYKNPESNLLELAEEYLSGNVRKKLQFAKESARHNSEFKRNVEALEKIIPADLTEKEIFPHMGANWIDQEYYLNFVEHLVGDSKNVEIKFDKENGKWNVRGYVPYKKKC